jgi:hypothetical protein
MPGNEHLSPEEVVATLPHDITLRLGFLADVPEQQARVNLGVQPCGTALLLEAYGLVHYVDHNRSSVQLAKNPNDEAAARMIRVTDFGGKVMSICQNHLPDDESREILQQNILDITEDRRRIINNALTDQPHPTTLLIHHLKRLGRRRK